MVDPLAKSPRWRSYGLPLGVGAGAALAIMAVTYAVRGGDAKTAATVFWMASASLGAFVAAGIAVNRFYYRRFRYPGRPRFLQSIRLRDDLATVRAKVAGAAGDGFVIVRQEPGTLVVEKRYEVPACVMTITFTRQPTLCHQRVTVKCLDRPWLDWEETKGMNVGPKKCAAGN